MLRIDLAGILDVLSNQELLLGFFLATAGLVFMVFGFKIHRPLVAISFGVLGFVLCSLLPVPEEMRLLFGLAGAMLFGAASTFFIRIALIILAGAWAGFGGFVVADLFELPFAAVLMSAVIAFACAVSLAMILYQEVTAFVLSLEGSLLFIAGLVVFMNQNPVLWSHIREMLVNNPVFAPFALLAGCVFGFYWQSAELRQRDAGTSA